MNLKTDSSSTMNNRHHQALKMQQCAWISIELQVVAWMSDIIIFLLVVGITDIIILLQSGNTHHISNMMFAIGSIDAIWYGM